MALQLLDPVYSQMPFFQPNQVLTYGHLNDLAAYLYQQERYSRNKLIGTGIVCGLSFSWAAIAADAQVLIDEGIAITSAGYLIVYQQPVDDDGVTILPYTHKRNFPRIKDFAPFKGIAGIDDGSIVIQELITVDQFDSETVVAKSILADADKTNKVLVLLFDIETLNVAKCLDENCDDKGKLFNYTPRPLLIPKDLLDNNILNQVEAGRSWKATESTLFNISYLKVPNLFRMNNLQNVNTPADLQKIFTDALSAAFINNTASGIDALLGSFPWLFNKAKDCMVGEVAALSANTPGAIFNTKVQTFLADAGKVNFIQYLYDFVRDVADAYNDLLNAVTDLTGECGGNELLNPFHVMLGLPQTNDVSACYQEQKFAEHTFKYRSGFIPSPVVSGQFNLYEEVLSLYKRLVRLIAYFEVNAGDTVIKVTPGKAPDKELELRSIPYYYQSAKFNDIRGVWRYGATRRNKLTLTKGYHLGVNQADLLADDTSKDDFYRIEGHIGAPFTSALAFIDGLRNEYNLRFHASAISIQPDGTLTTTCTFPDLEEEFNYYRDRVLGYLKEILYWLDALAEYADKDAKAKEYYSRLLDAFNKLHEILQSAKCIENFNYEEYKKAYVMFWELVFDVYALNLASEDVSKATQIVNWVLNLMNLIFFRPIYKVWYFYKYRIGLLTNKEKLILKALAKQNTGLEHLAGVRRGEEFLLVYDQTSSTVIADFSFSPAHQCGCGCEAAPCDGKNKAIISPLEKPVVMVVDYESKQTNALLKHKATYDKAQDLYYMSLDSMGFYKGDSTIDKVIILDKAGESPDLKGSWENEKLVLRYQINDNPQTDGFKKLQYILEGDFGDVQGVIYLFVIGRIRTEPDKQYTATIQMAPPTFYPYNREEVHETKPEIEFAEAFVDNGKGPVYTTPLGNQLGIFKDAAGYPFFMAVDLRVPEVQRVSYKFSYGGLTTQSALIFNVVNPDLNLNSNTFNGTLLSVNKEALREATITTSEGKLVRSNEKGEFNLTGLKAGEVITVKKEGYKPVNIQVNNEITPEIKLEKEELISESNLEKLNLPTGLKDIIKNRNIGGIRGFMK